MTWRPTSQPAALAAALTVLVAPLLLSTPAAARVLTGPTELTTAPTTFSVLAPSVRHPLGAPEGPGTVVPQTTDAPAGTVGEGILWLTMSGPGTSWASGSNTAVTVDVAVDGGPAQQIVLFDGTTAFTYTGFTGPLTVGPHAVALMVDARLSSVASADPDALLYRVTLGVLPAGDPEYAQVAHAPVLYGRHAAGRAYTPLLTSSADSPGPGGSHRLQYVLVVSAHDQGDSLIPAYQWGLWGRMTDIVTMLGETVSPAGAVSGATYASCGCESIPFFPDSIMAPVETTAPVTSAPFGLHPVLRDASATNYLSDRGTTPYRFQELPVAAPAPGQLRDEVMDEHPWTYQVSNQELSREHVISPSPRSLGVGDYRQYAIVDSDLSVSGTVAVEFDLRLAGDPTWYSTDYRQATLGIPSTFTFNNGGHTRTVIKLPLSWRSRPVVALAIRLEVAPGSAAPPGVVVHSLQLLGIGPAWTVDPIARPAYGVTRSISLEPVPIPG